MNESQVKQSKAYKERLRQRANDPYVPVVVKPAPKKASKKSGK